MIQYPTNVYPDNVTFDPTVIDVNSAASFTFNGDILTAAYYKVYDYHTGEMASTSAIRNPDSSVLRYNGEDLRLVSGSLSELAVGHDYVMQIMLTQNTADGSEIVYDMPIFRGTLLPAQDAASQNVAMIEKDVTTIYPWNFANGEYLPTYDGSTLVAGMVIQIRDERRFITKYQPDVNGVGMITLESPFSFRITSGMSYQIYSNFLITPQYYFKCRTTPTLSASMEWTPKGIVCRGVYNQEEGAFVKSWKMTLSYGNGDFIDESPTIYSQKIEWRFSDSIINYWEYEYDHRTVVIDVVTQDDVSIQATVKEECPTVTEAGISSFNFYKSDEDNCIEIGWSYTPEAEFVRLGTLVYRTSYPDGETVLLGIADGYFFDYTVSPRGRYQYTLVAFSGNQQYAPYESEIIDTNWNGYTVTPIYPTGKEFNGKPIYETRSPVAATTHHDTRSFKFTIDIANTIVTQNGDRMLHVGNGKYPTVSSTDTNYMSGEFSGMLGRSICPDLSYRESQKDLKEWKEYITKPIPFILRSQKGDLWVINIVDNPTTEYENLQGMPTKVNFSWVECCDINDIYLVPYWQRGWV